MRCTVALLAACVACTGVWAVPVVAAPPASPDVHTLTSAPRQTPIGSWFDTVNWQVSVARQTPAAVDIAAWRAMALQPGQTVSVRVMSGEELVGTFVRATDAAITLDIIGASREIPFSSVARVALRHGQSRLRRGMLVGAAIGLLPGSRACYSVKPESHCAAGLLAGAAIGGAFGGFMGSRASQSSVVYTAHAFPVASTPATSVAAPPASAPARPVAAGPRTTVRQTVGVGSPGDLAIVLTPFDVVTVGTDDGREVTGRFERVSASALVLDRKGHPREIGLDSVREVRRRVGTQVKRGAATGALAGMLLADVLLLSNSGGDANDIGGALVLGTIVGGAAGGVWGTIFGAVTPRTELIYRAPAPTVRFQPIVGASTRGALVSLQF